MVRGYVGTILSFSRLAGSGRLGGDKGQGESSSFFFGPQVAGWVRRQTESCVLARYEPWQKESVTFRGPASGAHTGFPSLLPHAGGARPCR